MAIERLNFLFFLLSKTIREKLKMYKYDISPYMNGVFFVAVVLVVFLLWQLNFFLA